MKHLFFCTTLLALFLLAGCADSATPPQGSAPSIPPAILDCYRAGGAYTGLFKGDRDIKSTLQQALGSF